jgi:hypothetical protein
MTTTTINTKHIELAREYYRLLRARTVLAKDNVCHDEAMIAIMARENAIIAEVMADRPDLNVYSLFIFMQELNAQATN